MSKLRQSQPPFAEQQSNEMGSKYGAQVADHVRVGRLRHVHDRHGDSLLGRVAPSIVAKRRRGASRPPASPCSDGAMADHDLTPEQAERGAGQVAQRIVKIILDFNRTVS
jgi:hypothetical protein